MVAVAAIVHSRICDNLLSSLFTMDAVDDNLTMTMTMTTTAAMTTMAATTTRRQQQQSAQPWKGRHNVDSMGEGSNKR